MNSYQAKQIPLIKILSHLGYYPVRKDKGGEEWVYNSPFRNEKIPSMFVNTRKNVWNDFGDRGGNVLDFISHYKNTNISGALQFLDDLFNSDRSNFKPIERAKNKIEDNTSPKQEKFLLDGIMPLKSIVLETYLNERAINVQIAQKYLQTVQFHHVETQTKYFGLGLENLSGSYEIRNPSLKAVVGKKDISFIKGMNDDLSISAVFESFIDFLSFLTDKKKFHLESDVIILNSTALAERAKDFIIQNEYQKIYTFFDNDKSGKNADNIFSELECEVINCNNIYQDYKDYNEFLQKNSQKNIYQR